MLLPLSPPLPDADVRLWRGFLSVEDADRLMAALLHEVEWRQDTVTVYGRRHLQPRLAQWFGPPGLAYRYSGVTMTPAPWPQSLREVRGRLDAMAPEAFNSALANLYRDGQDAMGWHADNEPELGPEPVIASLSLGATRDFRLKHRDRPDIAPVTLHLRHGDLLWMAGDTQRAWLHALPRRARVSTPRINLTFRTLVAPGHVPAHPETQNG